MFAIRSRPSNVDAMSTILNLSRPTNHDAEVSTCRRPRDSQWFQPPYFGSGKHAGLLRQHQSRVDKIRVFTNATAN